MLNISSLLVSFNQLFFNRLRKNHIASAFFKPISVVLAMSLILFWTTAAWAANGSASGTISSISGESLDTLSVELHQQGFEPTVGAFWDFNTSVTPDIDGTYSFPGFEPGTYRVRVQDFDFPSKFVNEFYNNTSDLDGATDIVVGDGQNVTDIDVELAEYGKITGRVTDEDGSPLHNISVIVYEPEDDGLGEIYWLERFFGSTDTNGDYTIHVSPSVHPDFRPGEHRVCFYDYDLGTYVSKCYDDAQDVQSATDITIGSDQLISDINAALAKPGTISGAVTTADGAPLEDVLLTIYRYQTSSDEWLESDGDFTTDEQGNYSVTGLLPGRYRIHFSADESYASQFYGDAVTIEDATDIDVASGQTTSAIDTQLVRRTAIVGKVTDKNGMPLSSIFVGVYSKVVSTETLSVQAVNAQAVTLLANMVSTNESWELARSGITNAEGEYVIYDLAPGTYRVGFNNSEALYHSGFFGDDAYYVSQATDIVLEAGKRVENVNTQMAGITLNVPPLAVQDAIMVAESGASSELVGLSRSLLANDEDAEAATLTAMLVVSPTHGVLTLNADGTFSYKHDGSETLNDAFAYVASDGTHTSDVISVTISVQAVNDAPVAVTDTISVTQGGTISTLVTGGSSVLGNDSDVDSTTLSAIVVQEPAFGTLTLNADGTFSYSHTGGSSKTDRFTYKVSDGEAESDPVDVTIQIDTTVGEDEPPSGNQSIYLPMING